jgi:D-alanyl-D-alanine carboxypeptidase (penicillin-binding protein 5/6)
MREAGVTLLIASGVLGLFMLFSPATPPPAPSVTIETPATPDAYANLAIEAKAAVVYDLVTGETLYAKNATAQLPLASLTKLLTVYAALAELPPETPITVPAEATQVEAPHALAVGQTFTLADLARVTLTASLNDGAVAIATAAAAHENRSQSEMLAGAAASLSLAQTYALNGSGLDVNAAISGGYGSASDLARLAGALVARAPDVVAGTTQPTAEAISSSGKSIKVKNTDPMTDTIPGLLLSKTGYTDLAGGNLALVFDAGLQHPIAVVVLGSSLSARFTDGAALVAATLAHFAGVSSL